MSSLDEPQARRWLSEARYARFRDRCGDDHDSTMRLYEWHAVLSMASYGLIHHFEVLIRNVVDAGLGEDQPQAPVEETWLLDLETLRPAGVRQVFAAMDRVERRRNVTRGRVVAGLSFSFWADLFGRQYEDLWRQRLRELFPGAELMRKDVSTRMKRIQRFRNRIAHHEPLLDQDVPALVDEMLELAGWIDPRARIWLESQTGVAAIAEQISRFEAGVRL
jgi:hypothetical protein